METESPGWLPRRKSYQLAILLYDLLRIWTGEEVEVECSTYLPIFDKGHVRGRWREQ